MMHIDANQKFYTRLEFFLCSDGFVRHQLLMALQEFLPLHLLTEFREFPSGGPLLANQAQRTRPNLGRVFLLFGKLTFSNQI